MEQKELLKNQTEREKNSKITIINKQTTNLIGVEKVISATENLINLILAGESMIIEGSNLHILKLDIDAKVVDFEGNISVIKFGARKKDKNFFKKIFS